jgi:molybdopterin-binding protein
MLQIDGLCKDLGAFRLSDVSFTVEKGDYFVLLGTSGAGKTVILELIAGLLSSNGGHVLLECKDITHSPIQERDIGLVYQDQALFPHMTVRRNIAYALPRREQERISMLAAEVGVTPLLDRRPASLSLGEAQRVALARTLARRPRILMLDEPLASLDVLSRAGIRSLLRRLHDHGQTILHVTHNYEEAVALATRVAVLEDGAISQVGTPDEVFHHPRSKFVASFVGIHNFFRGELTVHPVKGARFRAGPVEFSVATADAEGNGCVIFQSKDVTLSNEPQRSSVRNVFRGTIIEVEPVPQGIEVTIDIGVPIFAVITRESMAEMGLKPGVGVWVGFKSTAIRFLSGRDAR